ncbi:hypothetical protein [Vibrio sonorensis]|uniref:rhamnosyltransferase WsaF family glycosyltransferase n=1 Tax=Vibrio sonorensis TaxID=1004316 RepID=UPI0008D9429C|nr:hypothetical protein [Vibrio sonorensis]
MWKSKNSQWRNKFSESIASAHLSSEYANKSLEWFFDGVYKLAHNEESPIDFDEKFYLHKNEDVKRAVVNGEQACGYIHFCIHGANEKRQWSYKNVYSQSKSEASLGKGLFYPKHLHGKNNWKKYTNEALRKENRSNVLVILLPYLRSDLFFAGYTSFFDDISDSFNLFDEVKVYVTNGAENIDLLTKYGSNINAYNLDDIKLLDKRPSLIYCFDTETFFQSIDIFDDISKTVYYCQDYEAGFSPFGSMYARCQSALYKSKNIVFSTRFLRDFVKEQGLLASKNSHITAPRIDIIDDIDLKKNKRLFFYFRPEAFNTRNMPEDILSSIMDFCEKYSGYELFLVGTVDTDYSYSVNNNRINVISKLPKEEYISLIKTCDVVVSLIYSAHPGVIAYQTAASGIPTVTNSFANRTEKELRHISENIVTYDPIKDELIERLEEALQKKKGEMSFNYQKYSGIISDSSLKDFNHKIIKVKD